MSADNRTHNNTNTTNPNAAQAPASGGGGVGAKVKGSVKVAHGLGDTVRGATMGAFDKVEHGGREADAHEELVRRGRAEIEEGIAMIKGHAQPAAGTGTGTGTAAQERDGPAGAMRGWGTGINGANADATTNSAGFPPPAGDAYAKNSRTAAAAATGNNAHSDLGRGENAYSGNTGGAQPGYPPAPNTHSDLGRGENAYSGNTDTGRNAQPGYPPAPNMHSDLGRGENAYSGNTGSAQPGYPPAPDNTHSDLGRGENAYSAYSGNTGDAPPPPPPRPHEARSGAAEGGPGALGHTHPTQMGARPAPATGEAVGAQGYDRQRDADRLQ
ncbi:hypothetical protein GGX14DRAFT_691973 [Mycena pura]|uniref:Uncharacterized protein n=1 Tax=Mycena pura TaxID=153505 RepID=A0AAD6YU53_9AGAR|nr:hypothetical protein GGX14DRAFT_691973 [Mycena pura]